MLFSFFLVPVTVSSPIPPYLEVYGGIKEVLKDAELSDDGIIAVGSNALLKLSARKEPLFYSLVLYPERFVGKRKIYGVSFEPSPDAVSRELKKTLGVKKILILQTGNSKRYGNELLSSMKKNGFPVDTLNFKPSFLAAALEKKDFEVLFVLPDPEVITTLHLQWLSLYCLKRGKILVGISKRIIKAGGFMEITPHYREVGRLTGEIYHRWKNGERIKRIYRPEKVEVRINRKLGKLLGLNHVP
ncbi:hypothetical protein DRQ16_00085 [bacterium]|nr:MAG: hypothetical protein DRQ16_00085 [bacterium]